MFFLISKEIQKLSKKGKALIGFETQDATIKAIEGLNQHKVCENVLSVQIKHEEESRVAHVSNKPTHEQRDHKIEKLRNDDRRNHRQDSGRESSKTRKGSEHSYNERKGKSYRRN